MTTPSSKSKKIIYLGNFSFPNGDAGGLRVLGIGKALRDAGYRLFYFGAQRQGRDEDRQPDGFYSYQGLPYVPDDVSGLSRWKCMVEDFTGSRTMRQLKEIELSDVCAIIAYHASAMLLQRLYAFCRKRKIALLTDCTEWFDPRHLPGGLLGPFCWDSEIRMRWMQPKVGRVIAISAFLEQDLLRRGCKVIRIPPLIDMREREGIGTMPRLDDGVMRLVYSGMPGKKDLLGNAIRGLYQLRTRKMPVELHLVGADPHSMSASLGSDAKMLDSLGPTIVYHGRVNQPEAMNLVSKADFSILLRPDMRYANAGFPTKLAESLSLGVPMMTNLTSNIGEYVRDGKEGIILDNGSPEAFASGVSRALELSRDKWREMRQYARQRALDSFDYRNYISPLRQFLEEACAASR